MKTVKTSKGTELPLVNLKGKDYLMVAYRIQWMNEEVPNFTISTNVLRLEKDESVVNATVTIFDEKGMVIKSASATKREDSKGFADHLEKAETSAVGRALAMLGYGTQFALADLDEGDRLADSPLQASKPWIKSESKKVETQETITVKLDSSTLNTTAGTVTPATLTNGASTSSFRKPAKVKAETKEAISTGDGWEN